MMHLALQMSMFVYYSSTLQLISSIVLAREGELCLVLCRNVDDKLLRRLAWRANTKPDM